MKRKNALLALLMSVAMFAAVASGCAKDIDTSVPDSSSTTTTTKATTTTVTTTSETTTSETSAETTTAATTTAATKAAATTTKPVTATNAPVTTTTPAPTTTPAATTTTAPASTGSVGKYVYNTLSAEEKTVYDEIVAAIKSFQSSVNFSSAHDGALVTRIYQNVFFQEPSLFWFLATSQTYSGSTKSITLNYRYTQAEVGTMQPKIDAAVNAIVASFPANASVTQKLTIIHDTIIRKTTFSKDHANAKDAYGPLVAGFGQCEGYSKATAYVCNKLGIENVRVTGFNSNQLTHAWNKVLVNGKWYNIDLTFDDPTSSDGSQRVIHNYLLVPDSQINKISHFPDDYPFTAYPAANSLDSNYFVVNGLYASNAAEAATKLQADMTNSAKSKNNVAEVKCSSKEVYDAAINSLINQGKVLDLQSAASTASGNKITKILNGSDSHTLVIRINLVY